MSYFEIGCFTLAALSIIGTCIENVVEVIFKRRETANARPVVSYQIKAE